MRASTNVIETINRAVLVWLTEVRRPRQDRLGREGGAFVGVVPLFKILRGHPVLHLDRRTQALQPCVVFEIVNHFFAPSVSNCTPIVTRGKIRNGE